MRGIGGLRPEEGVTYIHLMVEAHQVVFAEGIPSDSFYPGPQSLAILDAAGRTALAGLLPALDTRAPSGPNATLANGAPARPFLSRSGVLDRAIRDMPRPALAG